MKIAAIGDAHLGRSAYTATTEEGVNQREFDFECSFAAAVDACLAAEPNLVVWLGDVFDHPRPTYRSFRVVMRALARLREHGVGLVAISGNHDTPRLPGTGNPYAVLDDAFPEFHFAYRMAYEPVDLPGVRIHCVPQMRTAEDTVEALHAADAGRSVDRVNLLITHPLVQSVERRYADINEIEIDDAELRSDQVLLGHYHVFTKVRPQVFYAGSTDTFSFGDVSHIAKGIVTLDTDSGECRPVALSGQRLLHTPDPVSAWGRGPAEIQDEVVEKLGQLAPGGIARLIVDGVAPEAYRLLDLGAIGEAAAGLLHWRLQPAFDTTSHDIDDLPELGSLGERWQAYVAGQSLESFDAERVARTGQEYLEHAIEAAMDTGGSE